MSSSQEGTPSPAPGVTLENVGPEMAEEGGTGQPDAQVEIVLGGAMYSCTLEESNLADALIMSVDSNTDTAVATSGLLAPEAPLPRRVQSSE